MRMRAAQMYGYNEPLRLEEIPVPDVGRDQVLVKVAATGMCRSDFQLVDGYFREPFPLSFPATPGHEVAGRIAALALMCPRRRACPRATW
jgi:alcohol dehydrogenase, propanol-preferring